MVECIERVGSFLGCQRYSLVLSSCSLCSLQKYLFQCHCQSGQSLLQTPYSLVLRWHCSEPCEGTDLAAWFLFPNPKKGFWPLRTWRVEAVAGGFCFCFSVLETNKNAELGVPEGVVVWNVTHGRLLGEKKQSFFLFLIIIIRNIYFF